MALTQQDACRSSAILAMFKRFFARHRMHDGTSNGLYVSEIGPAPDETRANPAERGPLCGDEYGLILTVQSEIFIFLGQQMFARY